LLTISRVAPSCNSEGVYVLKSQYPQRFMQYGMCT
jgi:hypothetical protein